MKSTANYFFRIGLATLIGLSGCSKKVEEKLQFQKDDHIVLIGNNLGSRMINYGFFEKELHLRYPDSTLFIRNMCDGGNRPGFRPHSGRNSPWAFPGAEEFYAQSQLSNPSGSEGHFETEDEWLTRLEADVIIAFFGFNESFQGSDNLENFRAELRAFVDHTLSQTYNGATPPRLVLVSPIAFEDLSDRFDLPDGSIENQNISNISIVINQVAARTKVQYVNVFLPSFKWFTKEDQLTIDGSQLNEEGYSRFAKLLADEIFGPVASISDETKSSLILDAVNEKNWMWHNDFKIPNGVHVFGRRFDPYGPDNYPYELKKIRQMTAIRDTAIWQAARGIRMDLAAADAKTDSLPEVKTNFTLNDYGRGSTYLYGEDAVKSLHVPPGYRVELFASEQEFPDLANPVQLSFDNKGRLWVAVMPSYPHYRPGDSRPNDKLIILEDTDGDGKADKQTTFVDGLHVPVGFELAPEGVYVSQGTNLKLYTDTDGDDQADRVEILLSGFDDHDTHHEISAFTADPSGAIYMAEGVFLHTNVETSYGPVRATNGGFYRYDPNRKRLERTAQLPIPNPWGIAFDDWGQHFFLSTSGPDLHWMLPGTIKSKYGVASPLPRNLVPKDHMVRPTSGLEFVSSPHFPDEVQGDILYGNAIGFLGIKQHRVIDDSTGYRLKFRQDLLRSDDKNFRPVDLEFAPDGSLYVVDWHNMLVGHMQHNARDPLRDHAHGRIYRITYPSRPLVEPVMVADASIDELLWNLTSTDYRTRYRTRRELRGRDFNEIRASLEFWFAGLDPEDPRFEHHLLELLWVTWGANRIDPTLLRELLQAKDYRVRAAAVRALSFTGNQIPEQPYLMMNTANDPNGRVRLETIVAASWFDTETGLSILAEAGKYPIDNWMVDTYLAVQANLSGVPLVKDTVRLPAPEHLSGEVLTQYERGRTIYNKDGYCATCHQPDGTGLKASGFPPLAGTKWVLGSDERLIKLTLKGLMGPMQVLETSYKGFTPMTPFGGLLNDQEIADVLTYVRNSFENQASPISAKQVKTVRESIADKKDFYKPEDLLIEHPHDLQNPEN